MPPRRSDERRGGARGFWRHAARLTRTRCPRDSSSRRTGAVLGLVTEPASASRDGAWWHGGIGLPAV